LYKSVEWKGIALGILEMRHYTNTSRVSLYKRIPEQLVTLKYTEEIEEVLQAIVMRYDGFVAERGCIIRIFPIG
jgi:hypothetical protein